MSMKGINYDDDEQDGWRLWPGTLYFIIIIEAIMVIPLCRALNYQKFKVLTYPILFTIISIFLCLAVNLIVRIFQKLDNDFCSIMRHNTYIPSSEMGITWANVVPSLCYAFGFQIYFL